uniref:hypothetical protein n=1 Tax=Salmonella sp. s60474 TaxID=3159724 RepID=UPI00397FADBD
GSSPFPNARVSPDIDPGRRAGTDLPARQGVCLTMQISARIHHKEAKKKETKRNKREWKGQRRWKKKKTIIKDE